MNVYFDNAATTRVRDEVVHEISDLLKNLSLTLKIGTKYPLTFFLLFLVIIFLFFFIFINFIFK